MSGAESVMKALAYGFGGIDLRTRVSSFVPEGAAYQQQGWSSVTMLFHCERDRVRWLRALRKHCSGRTRLTKGRGQRRNRRNRR